jgi:hypothetical protein
MSGKDTWAIMQSSENELRETKPGTGHCHNARINNAATKSTGILRVYSTTKTLNIRFILDAGASSVNMEDPVVLRISRRGEGSQMEQGERDQNIKMTRARR